MRISDWSSDVCSSDLAHLRAAVGDRDLARKPRLLPLAGNGGGEDDPVDLQPCDVDVDIGKQRLAGVGHRLEFGAPPDLDPLPGSPAPIDMVRPKGNGPQVEPQFGTGQETPHRTVQ